MYYEIINSKVDLEQKIVNFIDLEIDIRAEEKRQGRFVGRRYEVSDLLRGVFHLLIYDKILDIEKFKKYGDINEQIKFILHGMNIEIFNPEWLIDFPTKLNQKLAKNKEIKKKIEKYISSNLSNREIIEIYFKDYC